MSLNSVSMIGNLTRDPEVRYTASGRAVCNLSIANNRIFTKNGERASEVSYFDVEVWGNVAENCAKYLSKGSGIAVDGRLRQDRWEKDGKTQSRVRIVANNVHFLSKKGADQGQQGVGGVVNDDGYQVSEEPVSTDSIAWDE